jgi:hypothetical protein
MSESDFRSEDAREEADLAAGADESVTGASAETDQIDQDALDRADSLTVDPEVRENYQEAAERGANVQGEGQVP